MAKQIIVTQGDTGIELSVQFVDDKKKPIDITGKEIEVNFVNPNEEVYETMYAQIVDGTQGIASIILTDKHTSITDLHKTYWACMDDNGYVTAQTDLFYYVKEKLGGASITESNGELDADGFIEEINKIIEGQEYQQSLIETNAHNIQNNANSITSLRSETSKIKDLAEENKAKINSFVEQDANAKLLNEVINARQGENALVDNINKIKDSITNHNHDTQYAKPSDITTLTNNLNNEKANITKNTNDIANANNSIKELQEFKTNGGTIGGSLAINGDLRVNDKNILNEISLIAKKVEWQLPKANTWYRIAHHGVTRVVSSLHIESYAQNTMTTGKISYSSVYGYAPALVLEQCSRANAGSVVEFRLMCKGGTGTILEVKTGTEANVRLRVLSIGIGNDFLTNATEGVEQDSSWTKQNAQMVQYPTYSL